MSTRRRRLCGASIFAASLLCAVPSIASAGFPGPGPTTPPFSQCPAVGSSTSCSFLIRLTGSHTSPTTIVTGDPSNEFYDPGLDDEIVAVQNETDGPIRKIHLGIANSGDGLFGFEDDGICNPGRGATPTGCPFSAASTPEVSYMGPGMAFEPGYSPDDGTIDFNPPLKPGDYTFFGLDAPCTGNSCDVEIPIGNGNDYLTSELSEVANSSNSGAHITLTAPGDVTDQITSISGPHVSTAAGTISYKVYADPSCSTLVADATPSPSHFTSGSAIPASNPIGGDTSKFANDAEYYWQVTFTPDAGNANTAVTSTCGGETMIFGSRPSRPSTGITTTLSDGARSGAQLNVSESTPVTDSATINGSSPSTATGTVTYTVYSDSTCSKQEQVFQVGGDFRKVSGGRAPASAAVRLPLGKHYFIATYSGDSTHAAAVGQCGDEVLTVKKATLGAVKLTVASGTILNVVHPNGAGLILISGNIRNVAALARAKRCRAGTVRVKGTCVSTSFGSMRVRVLAAGRYVVKLAPNAAARRALARGQTLSVTETIIFQPSDGKRVTYTVRVTVKPPKKLKHRR